MSGSLAVQKIRPCVPRRVRVGSHIAFPTFPAALKYIG